MINEAHANRLPHLSSSLLLLSSARLSSISFCHIPCSVCSFLLLSFCSCWQCMNNINLCIYIWNIIENININWSQYINLCLLDWIITEESHHFCIKTKHSKSLCNHLQSFYTCFIQLMARSDCHNHHAQGTQDKAFLMNCHHISHSRIIC